MKKIYALDISYICYIYDRSYPEIFTKALKHQIYRELREESLIKKATLNS